MYTLSILITLFAGTFFLEDMEGPYETEAICREIGEDVVDLIAAEYGNPLDYNIICEKDDENLTVYPGR